MFQAPRKILAEWLKGALHMESYGMNEQKEWDADLWAYSLGEQ